MQVEDFVNLNSVFEYIFLKFIFEIEVRKNNLHKNNIPI